MALTEAQILAEPTLKGLTEAEIIASSKDDMTRVDGTSKSDTGYLDVIKSDSGKNMTEFSVGVEIEGKETLIPMLVPGLTDDEIKFLKTEPNPKDIPESIMRKAVDHAVKQKKEGKPIFFKKSKGLTEAEILEMDSPDSTIASDVGRVIAQPALEAGALTSMIIGLPEFILKPSFQLGGTAGIYQRGQSDQFKALAQDRYTKQTQIIEDRQSQGKGITEAMINNQAFYKSQLDGMTLKEASKRALTDATTAASYAHPDKYIGKEVEHSWSEFNRLTGSTYSFDDFKKDMSEETAVGITMGKISEGMESLSKSAEKAGVPKEIAMSLLELGTLYAFPKVTRATKAVADYTGSTSMMKRLTFLSDQRRDLRDLAKEKKKGNTVLAEMVQKNIDLSNYHPITKSNTGKMNTDTTVVNQTVKNTQINLEKLQKQLKEVNNQESFELAMRLLAKDNKVTDNVVAMQAVEAAEAIIIDKASKAKVPEVLMELQQKQYNPKNKLKSPAAQEIWTNILEPMMESNRKSALSNEQSGRPTAEKSIFGISSKLDGYTSRMSVFNPKTLMEIIKENFTGSRGARDAIYGAGGPREFVRAAAQAQVYFSFEKTMSPIIKEFVNTFKTERGKLLRDAKNRKEDAKMYYKKPAGPFNPDVVMSDGSIKPGRKLDFNRPMRNADGSIRRNPDFQVDKNWHTELTNLVNDLQILGIFKHGVGTRINFQKSARARHYFQDTTIDTAIEGYNRRLVKIAEIEKEWNTNYADVNINAIPKTKISVKAKRELKDIIEEKDIAKNRIELLEWYKTPVPKSTKTRAEIFEKTMSRVIDVVDSNATRVLGTITKQGSNSNLFHGPSRLLVTEFIKNKDTGKLNSLINPELTKLINSQIGKTPYGSLPILKSIEKNYKGYESLQSHVEVKYPTREEVAQVRPETIVDNPVLVEALKWVQNNQVMRDNIIADSMLESPYMKNKANNLGKRTSTEAEIRKNHLDQIDKKGPKNENGEYIEELVNHERLEVDMELAGFPEFVDLRMAARPKEILEDLFKRIEPNLITDISNAMVRNMLLNPLPHIHNEVVHLFGTAGIKAFGLKGAKELQGFMKEATNDVMTNSPFYIQARREGGSLMSTTVVTDKFMQNRLANAQDAILGKDSVLLKQVAKTIGLKTTGLYNSVAQNASRKGMWMTRDIMFLALIKMKMKKHNISMKQAIRLVEAHMPTYRMPTRVGEKVLGAKASRFLSRRILQDPRIAIFARYKHGMVSSGLNTIRDMAVILDSTLRNHGGKVGESVADFFDAKGAAFGRSTKMQFQEGVSSALALGVAMTTIYALIDELMTESLGGSSEAHIRRGGILHLIDTIRGVTSGEKDNYALFSNLMTINPTVNMALELALNTTFYNGRAIYDTSDPIGQIGSDITSKLASGIPLFSQITNAQDDQGNFDAEKILYRQFDVKVKSHKQIVKQIENLRRERVTRENKEKARKLDALNSAL
tara:strand:- start:3048 stop:7460 length:4413 start_codon:yes stop_codon:yes gene_type:complete